MPLHDHAQLEHSEVCSWESFHSGWAVEIVRLLNSGVLPSQYYARPHVKLGVQVESDVATLEMGATGPTSSNGGIATATWAPPRPTLSLAVDFAAPDLFEVRIHGGNSQVVAVIELVSPRNKDRPEARRSFAVKCASFLQTGVSVVVVDVVTERTINLLGELFDVLQHPLTEIDVNQRLYAAAFRCLPPEEPVRLEGWIAALALGAPLPTLPLWLDLDHSVPLDLERSYQETFTTLRIRP